MLPIIEVNHLSKRYRIGEKQPYYSFRDSIVSTVSKITKAFTPRSPDVKSGRSGEFWALKDISFKVMPGEVIGIIGRNGAGKSTLLKILSRITPPTKGEVTLRGRVASLLEVGTGFHPELTGRENIYLNGAILGMKRVEINDKFDEIVEFAEISKFLDTPVKFYSSGMYMRLAFAIAAHLDPEILLVDEVLAVGDAQFQKKCLGKMKEVSKQGRTVLFVSHNMNAVSTLVNNCIFLKEGAIAEIGKKDLVISKYMEENRKKENLIYKEKMSSKKPKITRVQLRTSEQNNFHTNSEPLEIEVDFNLPEKIRKTCITLLIRDNRGIACLDFSYFDSDFLCSDRGSYTIKCKFPKFRLYMGEYYVNVYFTEPPGGEFFQLLENICPFEVIMYGKSRGDWEWQPYTTTYIEDYSWKVITNNNVHKT